MRELDWRDASTYAWTKDLDQSGWAWEFLRRSPIYLEAWDRSLKTIDMMGETGAEEQGQFIGGHFEELFADSEFGIADLYIDPEEDNPDIKWFPPVYAAAQGESGIPSDYRKGLINISFNFLEPPAPQIKSAREELKRLAAEAKKNGAKFRRDIRPDRSELTTLLRVLDAYSEDPKPNNTEIAEAILSSRCPVDETATECPFDKPGADIPDNVAGECPLADEASEDKKCPLETGQAEPKTISYKHKQGLRYATLDYIHLANSEVKTTK